jgi:hypothetical protein
MVGGVVVPNGSVITADGQLKQVVWRVLQKQAFDINAETIPLVGFKDDLTQKFESFRNVGSDKEVELP